MSEPVKTKCYKAENFVQLHELLHLHKSHDGIGWIFRGQSDARWQILPKAGRPQFSDGRDLKRFNVWREKAVTYERNLPPNDWECLAVAQHHGLATRLLDWTSNGLVAAYFCVAENPEVDGAIFCYLPQLYIDSSITKLENDEGFAPVVAYIPRAITPRIHNQKGLFTYHVRPDSPLVPEISRDFDFPNLEAILIPRSAKEEILKTLDRYGCNKVSLFPDLDGLSAHINWETSGSVHRTRLRAAKQNQPLEHASKESM